MTLRDCEEALGQDAGIIMISKTRSYAYPYSWWDMEDLLWKEISHLPSLMPVQILRKWDTKTGLNARNLWWKTPVRENGAGAERLRTIRQWGRSDPKRRREKEGVLGGRVLDCSVVLRKVWQGHWGLSQSGPSEVYHLSWKKACPKIPAGLSVARTSPGEGRPGSEGWWISELSTWAADKSHFSQLEIWKAQSHGHICSQPSTTCWWKRRVLQYKRKKKKLGCHYQLKGQRCWAGKTTMSTSRLTMSHL